MKKFSVYQHVSPNGKKYIGITSLPVKLRWKNGTNYRNNPHFTHAIKKYGWDEENSMYMIEDAYGDREKLCEFEEYLKKGNIYEQAKSLMD